jgi:FADH2 O2-dependent halogenase
MLGTILACNRAKVVIIDAGTHPRFAVGESTVRHNFRMIKIMAERFGVPEFNSGETIHQHVSSGFGIKKTSASCCTTRASTSGPRNPPSWSFRLTAKAIEAHLFRQDTDAYLTYLAIHHAAVKHNTRVKSMEATQQGVTLETEKGEMIRARFVADASGGGPCALPPVGSARRSHTLPYGVPQAPRRWYQGTSHHMFNGGCVWVIPFDNRRVPRTSLSASA